MGLKEVNPWRPRRVDPRNDASHSYPSKTSSEVSQRPLIVSFLLRSRWANPSLLDPLPTIPASLLPPPQNAEVAQSRSFITGQQGHLQRYLRHRCRILPLHLLAAPTSVT